MTKRLQPLNFHQVHMHDNALFELLSQERDSFIFIKNKLSVYQYANHPFMELMGINHIKYLKNKTDYDLCDDRNKIKIYRQHDEEVFETEKMLSINEEVIPKKNEFVRKRMVGTLYPIYTDKSQAIGVLGIVTPQFIPFKLTLESALSLTKEELDINFIRRSYPIKVHNQTINLSKREIQCIIELIRGNHAGEIATILQLKQTTVESYLDNIKNKLGATCKSNLIQTIFQQKIIQQIIL